MTKEKKRDSFLQGILYMGIGTILAQLINVLVQPILTRIVSAETLGVYTYIVTLATMIIPIASLRLDMLIVSEADDNEAQYITDVCIAIVTFVSLVYLVIICVFYYIVPLEIFTKYSGLVFWVPVLVFTNGMRFLFISYNNRYKQYKLISLFGMIRETARAVLQIVSCLIGFGINGLLVGYAIAPLPGINIQLKDYVYKFKCRRKITIKQFKNIIVKGRRQLLFMAPANFINSFSASLITISITVLYSAKELGFYSVGVRVLEIPIVLVTANVSKVCYQKISENVRKKKTVFNVFVRVFGGLALISVIGFGVLYLIAPQLCDLVFGKGYYVAGEYVRCLCMMYAIRFVASSFYGIYTVFNKQSFELIMNVLLLLCGIVGGCVANILVLSVKWYLLILSIGYSIVYVIMLCGYFCLCLKHDKALNVIVGD